MLAQHSAGAIGTDNNGQLMKTVDNDFVTYLIKIGEYNEW